jgi:hypothetical protein
VHSHAGDSWDRCKDHVRQKIGAEPFKAKVVANRDTRAVDAVYDYQDENGELLFQVIRFKPKEFRQRRPDGVGGYVWNMDGVRRVPYHLPELLEAIVNDTTVFIAEGEKGANALMRLGVTATCSPGGAGKWRDNYSIYFKGAAVVLLPDNDEIGRRHAQDVRRSLAGVASSIRVLRLPGLPDKGDPFDWVAAGGTAEQLWRLVEDQLGKEPPKVDRGLVTRNAADIQPEAIEWIWPSRIARGKLTAIAGEPGLGKSQAALEIAAVITLGREWPNREGRAPLGRSSFFRQKMMPPTPSYRALSRRGLT